MIAAKRIVGFLLEDNGPGVTDLGVYVKADTLIKAVERVKKTLKV